MTPLMTIRCHCLSTGVMIRRVSAAGQCIPCLYRDTLTPRSSEYELVCSGSHFPDLVISGQSWENLWPGWKVQGRSRIFYSGLCACVHVCVCVCMCVCVRACMCVCVCVCAIFHILHLNTTREWRTDGRTDRWMDGWMDGYINFTFYDVRKAP